MRKLLRKIGLTLALLSCVVLIVAYAGKQMIESSPVYEASRSELQMKYGADPAQLSIRPFKSFKFSEGKASGSAEFILCDRAACYQVKAEKRSGAWQLTTTRK